MTSAIIEPNSWTQVLPLDRLYPNPAAPLEVEIGCGKGQFLKLICALGNNTGVGFDPAYIPGRDDNEQPGQNIRFIKDYFSEKYADFHGDFICCRMTLEHISDVNKFVDVVRRSIGDNENTTVFFQVPDVRRILQEVAFWDIYYEHCSYFSLGSLARLFRRAGFGITDLWQDYGNQYLMIASKIAIDDDRKLLPHFDGDDGRQCLIRVA